MKPLLFLDIDGVLNGHTRRFAEQYPVAIERSDIPASPFVRQVKEGQTLNIVVRLDPRVRDWLAELSEHFEIVWASTWEGAANDYLAPLLGIAPLDVVNHSREQAHFGEIKNGASTMWKWRTIVKFARNRPLAFVDDKAWGLQRATDLRGGAPTLVLVPRYGLSRRDVTTLVSFAKSLKA